MLETIQLKSLLNEMHETNYCALVGRGSTAIYVLLRALKFEGYGVVVPSTVCPAVPHSILLAGCYPVFCDINLDDYTLDIKQLDDIKTGKNIKALLAVHSFGHYMDIDAVKVWCDKHDVFLIEDSCQIAVSSNISDAVILSFGYSKPIECGDGGGLLLRNSNIDIQNAISREIEKLPYQEDSKKTQEEEYKSSYYDLRELSIKNPNCRKIFQYMGLLFKDMYLYQFNNSNSEHILKKYKDFKEIILLRIKKSNIYKEQFKNLPVILPKFSAQSVPWRYTIMVKSHGTQKALTANLRELGFHASNWYPSLSLDWGEESSKCVNSNHFERHAINLWLDNTMSLDGVLSTAKAVANYFNKED